MITINLNGGTPGRLPRLMAHRRKLVAAYVRAFGIGEQDPQDSTVALSVAYAVVAACWGGPTRWPSLVACGSDVVAYGDEAFEVLHTLPGVSDTAVARCSVDLIGLIIDSLPTRQAEEEARDFSQARTEQRIGA